MIDWKKDLKLMIEINDMKLIIIWKKDLKLMNVWRKESEANVCLKKSENDNKKCSCNNPKI